MLQKQFFIFKNEILFLQKFLGLEENTSGYSIHYFLYSSELYATVFMNTDSRNNNNKKYVPKS